MKLAAQYAAWTALAVTAASQALARPATTTSPSDMPPVAWTDALEERFTSVEDSYNSLHTLYKRDTVNAITSCRAATNSDLRGLSDAQLQVLMNNANALFNMPVTTWAGPRVYRSDMFSNTSFGGWNARLSILRAVDIIANGQNPASVCVDGSTATAAFNADSSTCSDNTINVYGTTGSTGSQVAVMVQQGYSIGGTVSTESSSGTTFDNSQETSQTNSQSSVSIDTNELGGSSATEIGFSLFGADSKETITIAYNHVWETDTSSGTDTSTTSGSTTGGDTSYTSGTQTMTQQDFTSAVTVTLNPPQGYTCYVSVGIASCKGSVTVNSPITFPSGMVLFDFGANGACYQQNLQTDGTCSQTSRYFYVPINTLLNGATPTYVTDNINIAVRSAGRYVEHCDAPSTLGDGGNSTTTQPVQYDTAYVPTLTCPKNLGVKTGCSVVMEDYLGEGIVTGDTGVWAQKAVTYTQTPGPATNVSFGQQYITFNASTPYQTATCTSLLQVVPPFSATFSPSVAQLALPQTGADLVGATYTVGYVGSCADSQYGACTIKNITSLSTPGFTWTRTSAQGNPIQTFNFGNGGGGWPETDQFTFNIQCTDIYGNTGGVQTYQSVYRNDVATQTITANTATYTFQSATKYLFTSISTLYTSVVTPLVTVDLNTATIYTKTSYTGTQTLTQYGAVSHTGTTTVTRTVTTIPTTRRVTRSTTVSPTPPTTTLSVTRANTTRVSTTTTLARATSTVSLTPTLTSTVTQTLCGAIVHARSVGPEERAIHSTTTVTDGSRTYTVTDYTDTATLTNSGTTVSTDYNDWATTTLQKTSTVYDPFDTTYVTTILYAQSTRVLAAFTKFSTRTRTSTSTSTSTSTRTVISSIPQKTATATVLTGTPPITTIRVTPTAATVSVNATTVYSTVTSTKTVTCTLP